MLRRRQITFATKAQKRAYYRDSEIPNEKGVSGRCGPRRANTALLAKKEKKSYFFIYREQKSRISPPQSAFAVYVLSFGNFRILIGRSLFRLRRETVSTPR